MTNKPSEYGASGIYRSGEPTLSNGEGSALALSIRGNAFIEPYPLQVKVVESGGYTYYCLATPGTAVATAGWRIMREDATGNVLFCDADDLFDNVASSPESLVYSYS
jgi:hypothetical protein